MCVRFPADVAVSLRLAVHWESRSLNCLTVNLYMYRTQVYRLSGKQISHTPGHSISPHLSTCSNAIGTLAMCPPESEKQKPSTCTSNLDEWAPASPFIRRTNELFKEEKRNAIRRNGVRRRSLVARRPSRPIAHVVRIPGNLVVRVPRRQTVVRRISTGTRHATQQVVHCGRRRCDVVGGVVGGRRCPSGGTSLRRATSGLRAGRRFRSRVISAVRARWCKRVR